MLREFWFPLLLTLASIIFGCIGISYKRSIRCILFSIAGLLLLAAILSYKWGEPVRGPFAGLTHPMDSDKFRVHAGIESTFFLRDLSKGIDFSTTIKNSPINLTVSRTWWSGWEFDITIKGLENSIEINNKKQLIKNLPSGWNYNSDDHAVEIVDANLNPRFQLIQDLDYDIYLNAILMFEEAAVVMNGDKLMFRKTRNRQLQEEFLNTHKLTTIFRYPSYMYRGKRL